MAISFSYDKRGAVWNFGQSGGGLSTGRQSMATKQRPVDYLLGHSEPILECAVLSGIDEVSSSSINNNITIVSGTSYKIYI